MLQYLLYNLVSSFIFSKNIKLDSGRSVQLSGRGPPVLFSTGLFGTMPRFLYNDFLSNLEKKCTIITFNDYSPLNSDDIDDVVNKICVDKIGYISHSSFNYNILENDKIKSAALLDPICLPEINLNGASKRTINLNYPILTIKASKLYDADFSLPDWQDPNFQGKNITNIVYKNVGHPDILNDQWANLAKNYGFWDSTNGEIIKFDYWNYKDNNIKKIRNKYRKIIAYKIQKFILK